ncbi:MAG: segregation/condensation protein A [Syntrophales bacterium]|nr:segregation/condensation protein A [Syntrophales bacterium]
MGYEIKLDVFEGPLDLLLYLIRKNEIDIYNIPVAVITEQYLQHVEAMKSLNLDVAGEYLVMASTLLLIKSRMLLPPDESDEQDAEEGPDPRAELVRQLLEYQSIKEASLNLSARTVLGRDIFKREPAPEAKEEAEDELIELSLFDLVEAFRKALAELPKEELMEIDLERISLSDRIQNILERLQQSGNMLFQDVIGESPTRKMIIYSFLAVLELMKLRIIRVFQVDPFGAIRIFPAVYDAGSEFGVQSSEFTPD